MAYLMNFPFAPAQWLPIQDREILLQVVNEDLYAYQGNKFENPEFYLDIVPDVHNYFAVDLFQRMQMSHVQNKQLVLILPSPENAVFVSLTEALNKFRVSCRNVHIFFLYEYANEKGQVAPWQSPYSRSGHFMRYFYQHLDPELRMPMEQIHFWTDDNIEGYSELIAQLGGADVAYTALSWSGGIGAIDAESFPANTMEELMVMGSRLVTPMPEMIAHDSLRGMFGCAGDIGNVPPRAVTVGPKDLLNAKEWIDVEYLTGCGGAPAHQKFPLRLGLFGPVCPQNPACLMRLHAGTCYVSQDVAVPPKTAPDYDWLPGALDQIAQKED